jgi:hypothetical protein
MLISYYLKVLKAIGWLFADKKAQAKILHTSLQIDNV